jgi:hypothetical protein
MTKQNKKYTHFLATYGGRKNLIFLFLQRQMRLKTKYNDKPSQVREKDIQHMEEKEKKAR